MTRSRTKKATLTLSLATLLFALPTAAQAKQYAVNCYLAGPGGDADGDGYAAAGSSHVPLLVDRDDRLTCPDGYVKRAGDCNDVNASIHPRRAEVAFNDVDDNCNGKVDETEPIFYAGGNNNTTSGFTIRAKINDNAILQHAGDLYVEVVLNPLDSSSLLTKLPLKKVTGLNSTNPYVNVVVSGVAPNRVFAAQLSFYRKLQFYPATGGVARAATAAPVSATTSTASAGKSAAGTTGTTGTTALTLPKRLFEIQIGEDSTWYYTSTDGVGSYSRMRTAIVLRALKEVEESRTGRVGYWGSPHANGARYGGGVGDYWCSEFYVWSVDDYLALSWDTSDELKYHFNKKGAYYTDVEATALRADWLHKQGHSAMFLAFDQDHALYVWSVDGNINNEVKVVRRAVTDYLGVGHLQKSLWYHWL